MERLKLVALDKEDLAIISTYCQDAVLKVGDLHFLASENRFVLSMNRFVWEKKGIFSANERRRTVLHFNQIDGVRVSGIDRGKPDDVLNLLAISFEPDELPAGSIHLVFSGGAAIRLNVECVEAQLADMDAAWKAKSRPTHR